MSSSAVSLNNACFICWRKISPGQFIQRPGCTTTCQTKVHFHAQCLLRWLKDAKNKCPNCQQPNPLKDRCQRLLGNFRVGVGRTVSGITGLLKIPCGLFAGCTGSLCFTLLHYYPVKKYREERNIDFETTAKQLSHIGFDWFQSGFQDLVLAIGENGFRSGFEFVELLADEPD